MYYKKIFFLLIFLFSFFQIALATERTFDLVVYGGSSSGVIAAYTGAKEGLKVALLAEGKHVGGLTASGLGSIDYGFSETIGGYTNNFFMNVAAQYGSTKPAFLIEPSVAEKTFLKMLQDVGVSLFYDARLKEKTGVVKRGNNIDQLLLENGDVVHGKMFIDASYEGDLMAWAKVSYTYGRESKAQYGESEAGVGVRPITPVKLSDKKLKEIKELSKEFPLDYLFGEVGERFSADKKTQAYTFRLTLTTKDGNKVPFSKPEGYNPARYNFLLERILKNNWVRFDDVCTVYKLPNEKTDINHLDLINAAEGYPDGSYAARASIIQYHKDYEMGYLYFVANDPAVPEALRKDAQRWGLAKDEFTDNHNWPYLLYTRETRRMVGAYVMRQQDSWEQPLKEDVIGMGSYSPDFHEVQQIITPGGYLVSEGGHRYIPFRPYQIPYRSLTPKPGDCGNLLVTTCLSSSHVIYGSLRMEPVYMILGHAAGVASALAIKGKIPVQQVAIKQLQEKLKAQGQIFEFKAPEGAYLEKKDYDGVIVDDFEASLSGKWGRGWKTMPFLIGGYRSANKSVEETATITFSPALPQKGIYEVYIIYAPDKNRARNAAVTVYASDGVKELQVDLTQKPADNSYWYSLGRYQFEKGTKGKVVISNKGADGVIVADAVRFVPR